MLAPASCPDPGDIQVWHATTTDVWTSPARVARARAWLHPHEQARYARFRHDLDRDMFLLGRAMARVLVGRALGRPAADWPWRDGDRGRPEVADADCRLSFNLAHSGGMVVCALGVETHVGVDVEDRQRPAIDRQIVERYCSPAERAAIDARGDAWQDQFLQYWTLKEAYLKARGLGIAVHLADLDFAIGDAGIHVAFRGGLADADPRWAFRLAAVGTRHYVAAAASCTAGPRPRFTLHPLPGPLLDDAA